MSVYKFLKKVLIAATVPGATSMYVVKQVSEHGVAGACKEEIKETPVINLVYKMGKDDGKYEGKKEGYEQASNKYEKKLLAQAKEFKKQQQNLKNNSDTKDALMKEYEAYIQEQEKAIASLSKGKRELLNQIKYTYKEISNL